MTQEVVREEAGKLISMLVSVAVGAWLLFLFALALAWTPLDRRFGLYARRHAARRGESEYETLPDVDGAYAIGPALDVVEDEPEWRAEETARHPSYRAGSTPMAGA